jgi:Ca2+-binding EF-hand superfamily protein
MYTYLN